ncbi:hypothetical protein Tsubulata_004165 [Turnera subulata]|uniref:Uncharacterized protein n=1 Tax=Turnera subulata TaxID=218843 RepID=A0A9Q0FCQ9_9ROSI|nr:hypothetical protein Tsubulata_004165 [Turnera subulata]
MALEYMEEFTPSNPGFSFTFDTQFTTYSPSEVTPKFGSFNPELTIEDKDKDNSCLQGSKHKDNIKEKKKKRNYEPHVATVSTSSRHHHHLLTPIVLPLQPPRCSPMPCAVSPPSSTKPPYQLADPKQPPPTFFKSLRREVSSCGFRWWMGLME